MANYVIERDSYTFEDSSHIALEQGEWSNARRSLNAFDNRDRLAKCFMSPTGALDWQGSRDFKNNFLLFLCIYLPAHSQCSKLLKYAIHDILFVF